MCCVCLVCVCYGCISNMFVHIGRVQRLPLMSLLWWLFTLHVEMWSLTWAQICPFGLSGLPACSGRPLFSIFQVLELLYRLLYDEAASLHFFRLLGHFTFSWWLSWLVFINLTQSKFTCKEGISREKMPLSNCL